MGGRVILAKIKKTKFDENLVRQGNGFYVWTYCLSVCLLGVYKQSDFIVQSRTCCTSAGLCSSFWP